LFYLRINLVKLNCTKSSHYTFMQSLDIHSR